MYNKCYKFISLKLAVRATLTALKLQISFCQDSWQNTGKRRYVYKRNNIQKFRDELFQPISMHLNLNTILLTHIMASCLSRSLKVSGTVTNQSATYDFLIVFHSNYGTISGTLCLRTLHLHHLYWCSDENWRLICFGNLVRTLYCSLCGMLRPVVLEVFNLGHLKNL